MCLHLLADSDAYHEEMGPVPSSNRRLDRALSKAPKAQMQWPLFKARENPAKHFL